MIALYLCNCIQWSLQNQGFSWGQQMSLLPDKRWGLPLSKESLRLLFFSIHHSYLSDSTYGPRHYTEDKMLRYKNFISWDSSPAREGQFPQTQQGKLLPLMLVFLATGVSELGQRRQSVFGTQTSRRHWVAGAGVSQRGRMRRTLQVLEKLQT